MDPSFVFPPLPGDYLGVELTLSYLPEVSLTGAPATVQVLSSARPAPPKVARVVPAWQIDPANGAVATGVHYQRRGGFLRVYLDRPWWSSGQGEMLGVVTLNLRGTKATPPVDPDGRLVTVVGLDPISLADPSIRTATTPYQLLGTTPPPSDVVGHPPYAPTPMLTLAENPAGGNEYLVHPYEVTFDPDSNQWFADVQVGFSNYPHPPPGYFVRLALVRFQPYSFPGVEVSPVALATYAQPVADRGVSVVEQNPTTVSVHVFGPAYHGYRPRDASTEFGIAGDLYSDTVFDIFNEFSPDPYTSGAGGLHTSRMMVEVQVQDTSSGLPPALAWQTVGAPVTLAVAYSKGQASWTAPVKLPHPVTSPVEMRLRISEVDYYPSLTPPTTVDTNLRRPFVTTILINRPS